MGYKINISFLTEKLAYSQICGRKVGPSVQNGVTELDISCVYCFNPGSCDEDGVCEDSQTKASIQENLDRIWVPTDADRCLADNYINNVWEKTVKYSFCYDNNNTVCEGCDTDCAIYDDVMYRAEYDLEFNIRIKPNTNMDETKNRFIGNQ